MLRGSPFLVWHFHTNQRYPLNGSWISVSRDKLAVNLVELTGNIWKAEPQHYRFAVPHGGRGRG